MLHRYALLRPLRSLQLAPSAVPGCVALRWTQRLSKLLIVWLVLSSAMYSQCRRHGLHDGAVTVSHKPVSSALATTVVSISPTQSQDLSPVRRCRTSYYGSKTLFPVACSTRHHPKLPALMQLQCSQRQVSLQKSNMIGTGTIMPTTTYQRQVASFFRWRPAEQRWTRVEHGCQLYHYFDVGKVQITDSTQHNDAVDSRNRKSQYSYIVAPDGYNISHKE